MFKFKERDLSYNNWSGENLDMPFFVGAIGCFEFIFLPSPFFPFREHDRRGKWKERRRQKEREKEKDFLFKGKRTLLIYHPFESKKRSRSRLWIWCRGDVKKVVWSIREEDVPPQRNSIFFFSSSWTFI